MRKKRVSIMSKKRQRTEEGVAYILDVADALEDIQDLVSNFSIEAVRTQALTISQRLKEIPEDVKALYELLRVNSWYVEASRNNNRLFLEISTDPGDRSRLPLFLALGFQEYYVVKQEDMERNSLLIDHYQKATYFDVATTHSDPVTVALQLQMLHDKEKNPMNLLCHKYEPITSNEHTFCS